jgi:hypothetical protein
MIGIYILFIFNVFYSYLIFYFYRNSYRTTLCLQYPPEQIGIGAIFTAAMYMGLQPLTIRNRESTWYELLETDIDENSLKSKFLITHNKSISASFTYL